MRALRLFGLSLLLPVHRLAYDLGREIVVGFSSLILMGVFFYVFNDFLNVQIQGLSPEMRDTFAVACSWAVLLLAAAVSGRILRADRAPSGSLASSAREMGEARGTIVTFLALRMLLVLALVHGAAWAVSHRWLVSPSTMATLVAAPALILFSLMIALWPFKQSRPEESLDRTEAKVSSPMAALTFWRANLIFRRGRLTRVCLGGSAVFLLLVAWAALAKAPPFVGGAAALAASLWAGFSLSFQVAEDLEHAWIERALGVSHEDYMKAYDRIAWMLAAALFVLAGLLWIAGSLAAEAGVIDAFTALKISVLAAIGPLCAPSLLFQIDARRPAVTILVLILIVLFVGTATLAHWLGLVLVPLARHFAGGSQAGRFYRA